MAVNPVRLAVGFAALLRGAGLAVPVGSVVAYQQALGEVGLSERSGVYWAGRATLVPRPEDIATYDRCFEAFWLGRAGPEGAVSVEQPVTVLLDDEDAGEGSGEDGDTPEGDVLAMRWSDVEVLRHQDFADCSDDELAEAQRLMARMRVSADRRRSRRRVPGARRRGPIDVRRSVRRALRTGGETVRTAHSTPGQRPRRLVLLLDVSGSMETYSRALLRFVHAAVAGRTRVEAFALGTRLTRLTRELATRDPDRALDGAAAAVADWSGGTRLGEGLRDFVDTWGQRGTARGAVVVILSDGWDRGDPELLAEQMGRLSRLARRVVWVNPLKASDGYEPLARGMAAALPYVDDFVAGHSLDSLEQLAAVIAGTLDVGAAGAVPRAGAGAIVEDRGGAT